MSADQQPSVALHDAFRAPYCMGAGCQNEECAENFTDMTKAIADAGYVLVPRAAIEHMHHVPTLTVEGSLICTDCGDHGFIRDNKWVPA